MYLTITIWDLIYVLVILLVYKFIVNVMTFVFYKSYEIQNIKNIKKEK